jgi:hypothetical protein
METAAPPSPEPSSGETDAGQAKVALAEKERSPANRPRAGPAQRGRKPAEKAEGVPPPGAGEEWACPVSECQDSAAHPLDECEGFKGLSVTKRRKAEGAQRMGSLRVLPHGLPGKGNRRKVLLPDRVLAAPLAETGSAARNITRQGLWTTEATISRGDQRSGPGFQGRSPWGS